MNEAAELLNSPISELFVYFTEWAINWIPPSFFVTCSTIFFIGSFIGMTPLGFNETLNSPTKPTFSTHIAIWIRKTIIFVTLALLLLPVLTLYTYVSVNQDTLDNPAEVFVNWFIDACIRFGWMPVAAIVAGNLLRLFRHRYLSSLSSKILKYLWLEQSGDSLSDIENEVKQYRQKDFDPAAFYDLHNQLFIGQDSNGKPLYVPRSTWIEVNMQIIGPTRYGKGVLAGAIADQSIRMGDSIFYIAPKIEKFIPYIMHNAAVACGRKFYYLDLNDTGPGNWGPFLGGRESDALSRVFNALGLDLTGDPGTDYYKVIERDEVSHAFRKGRSLQAILSNIDPEKTTRSTSTLNQWIQNESLTCKAGKGFSVERALMENAVVYVQGSLNDSIVKTATKCFINELVQETMRLSKERTSHVTMIVDEVRFLVSKQLADALATIVGFNVNIVTMYQSILDLLSPDDASLNGQSLLQSVNSNSQLKAIYGGADSETAKWVSDLSGETLLKTPKIEKTSVNEAGAEIWQSERMISTESQALIHANVVKVLSPRVCVLFRPTATAKVAFTSFVKVRETEGLDSLINNMNTRATAIKKQKEKPAEKEASVTNNETRRETKPNKEHPHQAFKAKPKRQGGSSGNAKKQKSDTVVTVIQNQ